MSGGRKGEIQYYFLSMCVCVTLCLQFGPCRIWLRKKQEAAVQTFWGICLISPNLFRKHHKLFLRKNISLLDSVYSAEQV